jgi:hypothetical protein
VLRLALRVELKTVAAMASGVPIGGVPHSSDQPTDAYLVEEEWEVGLEESETAMVW